MFLTSNAGGFFSTRPSRPFASAFASGTVAGGGILSPVGGLEGFLTCGGGVALPSGLFLRLGLSLQGHRAEEAGDDEGDET